ncbi:MAG: hypothetical protein Q8K05_16170 [Polaromonas sp.]|uniref:hypothetical protein n=1 Tax=Polaromonas sp. TaxID=1869339 RepID=UPI002730583D|nr:hypothetical protein [Polaromonas sp.]MDP2257560.1 hypothetical protein [Polaromonas sp.]
MKTAIKANRSIILASATAALAVAAMGFAGAAQARDDVYWSVGVGAPAVSLNVGNAQPVYVQPQPVYVQPAPVYYQPRPVYVRPAPVYFAPQPVYYGNPGRGHRRHGHGGNYMQAPQQGYGPGYYGPGYGPVSQVGYERNDRYDRDDRGGRHGDRR